MQTSSYVYPENTWANIIDGLLLSIRPRTKEEPCCLTVEVCPCELQELQDNIQKKNETNTETKVVEESCDKCSTDIKETRAVYAAPELTEVEKPAPKKRGRKPSVKKETNEATTVTSTPKKRGRKPKKTTE